MVGTTHANRRSICAPFSFGRKKTVVKAVPLPDLPYDYGALEPYISGEIMELHHNMHHGTVSTASFALGILFVANFSFVLFLPLVTLKPPSSLFFLASFHATQYVKNFNGLLEKQADLEKKGDYAGLISIQQAIKFNGGGHVNHSIFWPNMCAKKDYEPPSGDLAAAIDKEFGSLDGLIAKMSGMAAGVQGSGWGWLAYDPAKEKIFVTTTSNQDPLVTQGNYVPLLGVDVWEHAYYLQYKNKRPDYLANFFEVVNWKDVAERYGQATA